MPPKQLQHHLGLVGKSGAIGAAEPDPALELGALYRTHAPRVASWAARLGGPQLDAEDIVHEVFLIVHRELPRFRGAAKVSTWLYGITANVVRDRRRQERRRWLRHLLDGRNRRTLQLHVTTPAEQAERQQTTELVYKVLNGMQENYRNTLILFELEGHSGEEIAELTAVNLSTVWVWLHRARAQFRERLAKLHPVEYAAAARGKN
ncbi:MAG TPA: sigma-70 family RNA polymerase sigma factor [Pseudomonadota bacterium]|nr:sigma-70 family RNA polymerase sigma factor [Pseudomonadota bacterium]